MNIIKSIKSNQVTLCCGATCIIIVSKLTTLNSFFRSTQKKKKGQPSLLFFRTTKLKFKKRLVFIGPLTGLSMNDDDNFHDFEPGDLFFRKPPPVFAFVAGIKNGRPVTLHMTNNNNMRLYTWMSDIGQRFWTKHE